MYVDGYMLLAIYVLAVLAAAISVYSLWTLEEMKENGKKWVALNQELMEKVKQLEYISKFRK
jgi:CHASE3 domain sensor protein